MFSTYTEDTVTSGGCSCGIGEQKNTFYHSYINRNDWDFILDLLNTARTAAIFHGCFEDESYEGRARKLDKKKVKEFDKHLQDVVDRLYQQCRL